MYLFTRTARIAQEGRVVDKLGYAVELTAVVSEATGVPMGLHAAQMSPGVGTVVWSIFSEDLATLEAAGDRLAADDIQDFIATRGVGAFVDGMDDTLYEVLHGTPDPDRQVDYVAGVAAQIGPGKIRQGIGLGIELAEKSSAISGQDVFFVSAMSGLFGGVGWLTAYPDITALQEGQRAVFSDPAMLDLIDGPAADTFPSTGTTSTIYRRLV